LPVPSLVILVVSHEIEPDRVGFVENPVNYALLPDFVDEEAGVAFQVPFLRVRKDFAYFLCDALLRFLVEFPVVLRPFLGESG